MIVIQVEQGSPAWHSARVGIPTASRFAIAVDVIPSDDRVKKDGTPYKERERADGKVAGDPSPASDALLDEYAVEQISGEPYGDVFQTFAMKRGSEQEQWARVRYEELYSCEVTESGICLTDDRAFGYSTDGFVGDDGLIEIKTPLSLGKIRHILETDDDSEYLMQVMGGLWISGRKWCDLVMYVPALSNIGNDIYVKRIYRDEEFIAKLELDLWAFHLRLAGAVAFWRKQFRRDGLDQKIVDVDVRVVAPWDELPGVPAAKPKPPRALRSSLASLLLA